MLIERSNRVANLFDNRIETYLCSIIVMKRGDLMESISGVFFEFI